MVGTQKFQVEALLAVRKKGMSQTYCGEALLQQRYDRSYFEESSGLHIILETVGQALAEIGPWPCAGEHNGHSATGIDRPQSVVETGSGSLHSPQSLICPLESKHSARSSARHGAEYGHDRNSYHSACSNSSYNNQQSSVRIRMVACLNGLAMFWDLS